MDKPFSIDFKRDGDSQDVIIAGELIINHIDVIKAELVDLIDYSKKINIKITNPSSMDITFIQIILAIKAAYKNNGLGFNIEGTLNEDVFNLVVNAGFKNLFKL